MILSFSGNLVFRRIQIAQRPGEFGEDIASGFSPNETVWAGIVLGKIGEDVLGRVEPKGGGRGKVEGATPMGATAQASTLGCL